MPEPEAKPLEKVCRNNHEVKWTQRWERGYRSFSFGCDVCHISCYDEPNWHCAICSYDICKNCLPEQTDHTNQICTEHKFTWLSAAKRGNIIFNCFDCHTSTYSGMKCSECNLNVCNNCSHISKDLCPNSHKLVWNLNKEANNNSYCEGCSNYYSSNYGFSCKECNYNICGQFCQVKKINTNFCPDKHVLVLKYEKEYVKCEKCLNSANFVWNCSTCDYNICKYCGPDYYSTDESLCPNNTKLKYSKNDNTTVFICFLCSTDYNKNPNTFSWKCSCCCYSLCGECGPKINVFQIICHQSHVLKYTSPQERIDSIQNNLYSSYQCNSCYLAYGGSNWHCSICSFDLCQYCRMAFEGYIDDALKNK